MSRFLSISKKVEILKYVDLGNSERKTAQKFNIAKSTVQRLKKEKDSLHYYINDGTHSDDIPKQQRTLKPESCNINSLVLIWFERMKESNFLVSGASIKAAAKLFAHRIGNFEFKASNGWLKSFLKQQGITLKSLRGELVSSNLINEIIQSVNLNNIEDGSVSSNEVKEPAKKPKLLNMPKCSEFTVRSVAPGSPESSESSSDFIIKDHYSS